MPYRPCTFDHVLGPGVLAYLSSLDEVYDAVAECVRVLKPGGSAVFSALPFKAEGEWPRAVTLFCGSAPLRGFLEVRTILHRRLLGVLVDVLVCMHCAGVIGR